MCQPKRIRYKCIEVLSVGTISIAKASLLPVNVIYNISCFVMLDTSQFGFYIVCAHIFVLHDRIRCLTEGLLTENVFNNTQPLLSTQKVCGLLYFRKSCDESLVIDPSLSSYIIIPQVLGMQANSGIATSNLLFNPLHDFM